MGVKVFQGTDADHAVVGGDIRQIIGMHQLQRADLFPVKGSGLLGYAAIKHLLPFVDGGDTAGCGTVKHGLYNEGGIDEILVFQAKIQKSLAKVAVLDAGIGHLAGHHIHVPVTLMSFLGGDLAFASHLGGVFRREAVRRAFF